MIAGSRQDDVTSVAPGTEFRADCGGACRNGSRVVQTSPSMHNWHKIKYLVHTSMYTDKGLPREKLCHGKYDISDFIYLMPAADYIYGLQLALLAQTWSYSLITLLAV